MNLAYHLPILLEWCSISWKSFPSNAVWGSESEYRFLCEVANKVSESVSDYINDCAVEDKFL